MCVYIISSYVWMFYTCTYTVIYRFKQYTVSTVSIRLFGTAKGVKVCTEYVLRLSTCELRRSVSLSCPSRR